MTSSSNAARIPEENLRCKFLEAGIFPHNSAESLRHEARLAKALSRSYRQAKSQPQSLSEIGVSSKNGPLAEETERLMLSHYDERAELFINFLDSEYMAYSMAYYGETPTEVAATTKTLEGAQEAKFELFCSRAQLSGKERIFNIGCGFGSLETFLLQKYPEMEIVGLTPSKVQLKFLRAKIEDKNDVLGCGRFTLIDGDFDAVPLESLGLESFDAIFSVGVLEHIKNLSLAFERMSKLLKPGGIAFHHLIASFHVVPRFLDTKKTRIDEYFPGGRVWPFSDIESHTDFFSLENSWYVNGMNYWKTLDEWHKRFWENIATVDTLLDTEAIRHWNDYFSLCKIVFSPMEGDMVGNGQYLFRKS